MSIETLHIERCHISGFKSIRNAQITLRSLTVLIGANGAGKSNLVAYFSMLHASLDARLDSHVGRLGGPKAFLYLGPQQTSEIRSELTVNTEAGRGTLFQRLEFQSPDNLIYSRDHSQQSAGDKELVIDGLCSVIRDGADGHPGQLIYFRLKDGIGVYHFHDTSLLSPIRTAGYIEDNQRLHSDGSNLAAVLFRLREKNRTAYQRIVNTIRLVTPFFDDFSLSPRALDSKRILLNWKQIGCEYEFGPHQLSDGTLRSMALITILLQPEAELPRLLVIDEPEIGLHPYALNVIVGLLRKASHHAQVIVATQSPQMLDHCEPDEIVCVERNGQESIFTKLDPEKLHAWLEEYSLSEVWQKNVFGGGPH